MLFEKFRRKRRKLRVNNMILMVNQEGAGKLMLQLKRTKP